MRCGGRNVQACGRTRRAAPRITGPRHLRGRPCRTPRGPCTPRPAGRLRSAWRGGARPRGPTAGSHQLSEQRGGVGMAAAGERCRERRRGRGDEREAFGRGVSVRAACGDLGAPTQVDEIAAEGHPREHDPRRLEQPALIVLAYLRVDLSPIHRPYDPPRQSVLVHRRARARGALALAHEVAQFVVDHDLGRHQRRRATRRRSRSSRWVRHPRRWSRDSWQRLSRSRGRRAPFRRAFGRRETRCRRRSRGRRSRRR